MPDDPDTILDLQRELKRRTDERDKMMFFTIILISCVNDDRFEWIKDFLLAHQMKHLKGRFVPGCSSHRPIPWDELYGITFLDPEKKAFFKKMNQDLNKGDLLDFLGWMLKEVKEDAMNQTIDAEYLSAVKRVAAKDPNWDQKLENAQVAGLFSDNSLELFADVMREIGDIPEQELQEFLNEIAQVRDELN